MKKDFENAWNRREQAGELARLQAVRVFHGATEGRGETESYAIDRFGEQYWVTHWGSEASPVAVAEIKKFLESKNAIGAVLLDRPEREVPDFPKSVIGEIPRDAFIVQEGKARYLIRFHESRHPGLFLDHEPLRRWLIGNCKHLTVLNTFAYTGSLSVAAALGGAKSVTTLDLSRPTIEWAQENWRLNDFASERGDFIYGDYFEWMPRFKKKGRLFDRVILDPPSFSRGKKGNFSTSKDLKKLHLAAWEVLAPHGMLATSINSANVSRSSFLSQIESAADELDVRFRVVQEIGLPSLTFPQASGQESYLKGYVLQRLA